MSSTLRIRHILKGLVVTRLFNAWTRGYLLSTVVKRCRRDRGVREVIQCFRHAFLRPKRTLLLYATAAFKSHDEETPEGSQEVGECDVNIADEEMQARVTDLDGVEELSHATLYCPGCAMRVVLDKKQPGVRYCGCKDAKPPQESFQGWVPYMEAEDVIIWRKEYKPGQGLYAYKVYGRYKDIRAQDFAAVQVDISYRRAWDNAVAALAVVDQQANGVPDQTVLHWEVLWPRLFANRDYVYIRRHKEFSVKSKCLIHKEGIFNPKAHCDEPAAGDAHKPATGDARKPPTGDAHNPASRETTHITTTREPTHITTIIKETHKPQKSASDVQKPPAHKPEEHHERPSVHSNAKRKAMEHDKSEQNAGQDDKVYVIISRSCFHNLVPPTRHVIRVTEYWSNMVIKTLDGPDKLGTEFVLTYYDEPAVGGMPSAVASFATARGVPAFLARMRQAAHDYASWRKRNPQDAPAFTPFGPEKVSCEDDLQALASQDMPISEQDMESSKQGPDLENGYKGSMHDQGTQTDNEPVPLLPKVVVESLGMHQDRAVGCQTEAPQNTKLLPRKRKQGVHKPAPPTEDESPEYTKTEDTYTKTDKVPKSPERENKTSEGVNNTPEGANRTSERVNNTPEGVRKSSEVKNKIKQAPNAPEKVVPEKDSEMKEGEKLDGEKETEEDQKKSGWYRYLYPLYYFV